MPDFVVTFVVSFGFSLCIVTLLRQGRRFLHYFSYNETEKRKEKKMRDFTETQRRMREQFKQELGIKEKVDAIMPMQEQALEKAGHKNFLTQEDINRMRDQVMRVQKQKTSGRRRKWI